MARQSKVQRQSGAQLARIRAGRAALAETESQPIGTSGLSASEVELRRELGLDNQVNNASSRSLAAILRANVFTLFNMVSGGAFLLLLLLWQWKDALFGLAVIANVLIGAVQEFRAKRTLDKLSLLHQPKARVLRDGVEQEIATKDVVLDDLLVLRLGDQVLADAVIVDSSSLEADESMLTGESDAVLKTAGSHLLAGSGIVGGSALARVDKIGPETYASALTLEAKQFSTVSSELRSAISRVVKWISWALLPIMVLSINGQMIAAGGWSSAVASGAWVAATVSTIASVISMVPQGFVLMTSLAFAIAAATLARKNVLVQELPAVEGLARVDTICFDKTGTLTEGTIVFDELHLLPHKSMLQATEVLAVFGADQGANATTRSLNKKFNTAADAAVTGHTPFDSTRKWSAFTFEKNGHRETWVLGAPEFVLNRNAHSTVLEDAAGHASAAKRTLVLAFASGALNEEQLPSHLAPAALITLHEKIRSDAAETLHYFKQQGVSVKIISGDNQDTVAALAKRAGLEFDGVGVDSRTLPDDEAALADALEKHTVFGRVTPEQKRNFVLAMQSRGHVVAMTGDGVNDALALKKADLGIAMDTGAAATKAVANMVLIDGQFSSLPSVVAEGRKVIANIERVSRLFLTKTTWSMLLTIVFGVLMWTFPYLPRQLSLIDGFTIGLPAFALALLPNPKRYEAGFLKRSLWFCVPAGIWIGLAVITLSALMKADGSWSASAAQTATSVLMGVTGVWILTLLSRPLDKWRSIILAVMVVLAALEFLLPIVQWYCGWVYLTPTQLLTALSFAFLANALISLTNLVIEKLRKRA